jgi:hypothetical protein
MISRTGDSACGCASRSERVDSEGTLNRTPLRRTSVAGPLDLCPQFSSLTCNTQKFRRATRNGAMIMFTPSRTGWALVPGALALLLLGLAGMNGCGQKGTAPGACQVNGDCAAGSACVAGECKTGACISDADCADAGEVCLHEFCSPADGGTAADAGSTGPCTLDSECGAGALCIAGECIAQDAGTGIGCSTSADCPANESCVDAQCTVTGGGTGGCSSATDCANNATGTACVNGSCGCTSPSDCLSPSDSCVAGQCTGGGNTDAGTIGGGGTGGGGIGGTCTSDNDCVGNPTSPVCDTSAGQCVPCTSAENKCPNGQSCVTDTCVAGGGGGLGGGGSSGGGGGGGGGGTCLPLSGLCSVVCGVLGGMCDASGNCCI